MQLEAESWRCELFSLTYRAASEPVFSDIWSILVDTSAELQFAKGLVYLEAAIPLRSTDLLFTNNLLYNLRHSPQKRFLHQFGVFLDFETLECAHTDR